MSRATDPLDVLLSAGDPIEHRHRAEALVGALPDEMLGRLFVTLADFDRIVRREVVQRQGDSRSNIRVGYTETIQHGHRVDLSDWEAGTPWPSPPCGAVIEVVISRTFEYGDPENCAHCDAAARREASVAP